jgi:ABC-type Mn2+/Zn2+ transport system ATPase subunit
VFWLAGMAGTGKSTLAKTSCETLSEQGYVAAIDFVSRQSVLRRNAFNLVRTLAHEITGLHWSVLDHLCHVVQERSGIADRTMKEQLSAVVVDPLKRDRCRRVAASRISENEPARELGTLVSAEGASGKRVTRPDTRERASLPYALCMNA